MVPGATHCFCCCALPVSWCTACYSTVAIRLLPLRLFLNTTLESWDAPGAAGRSSTRRWLIGGVKEQGLYVQAMHATYYVCNPTRRTWEGKRLGNEPTNHTTSVAPPSIAVCSVRSGDQHTGQIGFNFLTGGSIQHCRWSVYYIGYR